jgi:NAD(P)H-dependent FMN reductase
MTGMTVGIREPVNAHRTAGEPDSLRSPGEAQWSTESMPAALAAAQRHRLITRLLPLLPGPEDERLSTTHLGVKVGLTSLQRARLLLPFLTRFAASGLLDVSRRGRSCSWRATPLLPQLLGALRDTGPATAGQFADRLGVPAGTLGVALGALAWCQLAEYTDTDSAGRYWRRRDRAAPITVVTINGSTQPGSRTRHLADCALTALTGSGAFRTDDHHVLQLGELERPCSARTWLNVAVRVARRADLLIVAAPTRLGTFPGLLKHFLDQLGPDAFTRTVAVIAVVDDTNIVPCPTATALTGVLDHLGARLPVPPLILRRPADPDEAAADWVAENSESIRRILTEHTTRADPQPSPAGGSRPQGSARTITTRLT